MIRAFRIVPTVVACAFATGLMGCAPQQPASTCGSDRAEYIGGTLEEFSGCIAEEATLLIQDASPRVGQSPSFTDDPGARGSWRVVEACSSGDDWRVDAYVEVAVIPIAHEAPEADFSDAVVCDW